MTTNAAVQPCATDSAIRIGYDAWVLAYIAVLDGREDPPRAKMLR